MCADVMINLAKYNQAENQRQSKKATLIITISYMQLFILYVICNHVTSDKVGLFSTSVMVNKVTSACFNGMQNGIVERDIVDHKICFYMALFSYHLLQFTQFPSQVAETATMNNFCLVLCVYKFHVPASCYMYSQIAHTQMFRLSCDFRFWIGHIRTCTLHRRK